MKQSQPILYPSINKGVSKNFLNLKIKSIDLCQVDVHYNSRTFEDVSFNLMQGNMYGLAGSEKERKLVIELLCGRIQPQSGKICINNTVAMETIPHWASEYVTLVKNNSEISTWNGNENTLSYKAEKHYLSYVNKLFKTAAVLILDDAMAALDAATEEKLLMNYALKNKNKIIILNTKRSYLLKYCDRIIAVKNKKISEIGKHQHFNEFLSVFKYYP
jgi:ABC-type multidrug transport system fused ATPase/permease subunit